MMQPCLWEVVILKPTQVFYSFLTTQFSDVAFDLNLLDTDNTVYIFQKQENDEKTLALLECHFKQMFRHEICRWLGQEARNEIESKFLDFLCCFKFELHSHVALFEPTMANAKQMLSIKPRKAVFEWLKKTVEEDAELTTILTQIPVTKLSENATVIIKNFKDLADIKPFLVQNYQTIFEVEMLRMCDDKSLWPVVDSFEAFTRFFEVKIHTQVFHL